MEGIYFFREQKTYLQRVGRVNKTNIGMANKISYIKRKHGYSLIEVLIAIAILGAIAAFFAGALGTSYRATYIADERETARDLAQHQMEYIKNQGYAITYAPAAIPSEYAGYTVTINTSAIPGRDGNIQDIKIVVSHQGKPILMSDNATLEDYKVIR